MRYQDDPPLEGLVRVSVRFRVGLALPLPLPLEGLDRGGEAVDRVDVQVVGRLVEQQHLWGDIAEI